MCEKQASLRKHSLTFHHFTASVHGRAGDRLFWPTFFLGAGEERRGGEGGGGFTQTLRASPLTALQLAGTGSGRDRGGGREGGWRGAGR